MARGLTPIGAAADNKLDEPVNRLRVGDGGRLRGGMGAS